MVINFVIMCNKNQFLTKHMETKTNINLNVLLTKNKYKNTLLMYNKNLKKKMIRNL